MGIEVLKFTIHEKTGELEQSELHFDTAHELESVKEKNLGAAFLTPEKNLSEFRQLGDRVIDRGVKHKRKRLSDYLLGHEKIPLIDGNFSDASQVCRSIRQHLSNAKEAGDSNAYIIGSKETIFDELRGRASTALASTGLRQRPPKPKCTSSGTYSSAESDSAIQSLRDLMKNSKESANLSESYIGKSEEADLVRMMIVRAAAIEAPVLILGASGTGKGIVASTIHALSSRRLYNFVVLNCSAIPSELLELELFGCEENILHKGYPQRIGLWEFAGKGTFFMDEIGDLALNHQAKILRALEDGKIRRVGGLKEIEVPARVIAATNRDIYSMTRSGKFREDLYYRLRKFLTRTPALDQHPEDVPLLAIAHWKKITNAPESTLSEEILEELESYRWPGNVRELNTLLSSVHAFFGEENLRVEHFRAVLDFERQVICAPGSAAVAQKGTYPHLIECLRHLRQADELIDSTKSLLQSSFETQDTTCRQSAESSIQNLLKLRLNELEQLCRRPLLFNSKSTFSLMNHLKGELTYLQGLLERDRKDASDFGQNDLAEELEAAKAEIVKEVERIWKQV